MAIEVLGMQKIMQTRLGLDMIESLLIAFSQWKISLLAFASLTILILLWAGRFWLPKSTILTRIGANGFPIYLTHMFFADPIYFALEHIYPPLLTNVGGFIINIVLMLILPMILAWVAGKLFPRFGRLLLGS